MVIQAVLMPGPGAKLVTPPPSAEDIPSPPAVDGEVVEGVQRSFVPLVLRQRVSSLLP
jgi:hypothetical protein